MNKFSEHFDGVQKFLETKGIDVEIVRGKKATTSGLKQFHKKTGVNLPDSFSEFYTGFANGYAIIWHQSDEVGSCFSMPTLEQLALNRLEWSERAEKFANDPNSMSSCMNLKYRAKAFQIWEKMKNWVPFWDEGNGDKFCLDLENEQIVYDQHHWFDGFGSIAKTNGILAGENLSDFIGNWSRFCFLNNKSLWWGEFGKFGGIKWEPKYFNREFFRKS